MHLPYSRQSTPRFCGLSRQLQRAPVSRAVRYGGTPLLSSSHCSSSCQVSSASPPSSINFPDPTHGQNRFLLPVPVEPHVAAAQLAPEYVQKSVEVWKGAAPEQSVRIGLLHTCSFPIELRKLASSLTFFILAALQLLPAAEHTWSQLCVLAVASIQLCRN